jgi:hypothetical protein
MARRVDEVMKDWVEEVIKKADAAEIAAEAKEREAAQIPGDIGEKLAIAGPVVWKELKRLLRQSAEATHASSKPQWRLNHFFCTIIKKVDKDEPIIDRQPTLWTQLKRLLRQDALVKRADEDENIIYVSSFGWMRDDAIDTLRIEREADPRFGVLLGYYVSAEQRYADIRWQYYFVGPDGKRDQGHATSGSVPLALGSDGKAYIPHHNRPDRQELEDVAKRILHPLILGDTRVLTPPSQYN